MWKEGKREREKMNGGREDGGKKEEGGRKEKDDRRRATAQECRSPLGLLAVIPGISELSNRRLCWWVQCCLSYQVHLKGRSCPENP